MRDNQSGRCARGARIVLAVLMTAAAVANAKTYSIREIQYTTDSEGRSPLEGQVIDCRGGIVTNKFGGGRPKLTVQDPNCPLGWGAIQVRDGLAGAPLFQNASVGDRIALSNVRVEEFFGNTTLQCLAADDPSLIVVSGGNPLPEPLGVAPAQIAAPVEGELGDWRVRDHTAEKYEHMRVAVARVAVGERDLGKAADNYVLRDSADDNEPIASCWATDYMNGDAADNYHPVVVPGQALCLVEGILEQFTNTLTGWDYYQLVTTGTEDFLVLQPADFDDDCDVDFSDFAILAERWLADCAAADPDGDLLIRANDLAQLADHWLDGASAINW